MKRTAVSGKPVIEDTFVPELEAEEARLAGLLQTAKDEAAEKVRGAERAAQALSARERETLSADLEQAKRERSASASDERHAETEEMRSGSDRLLREARQRLSKAVDTLIDLVFEEREAR